MIRRPQRVSDARADDPLADDALADEWVDAGLGASLMTQCGIYGWTLGDVCEVLCADQPTPVSADCLRLGVHPLEVLATLEAAARPTPPIPLGKQG